MKKEHAFCLALLLSCPFRAAAATLLDGSWQIDAATMHLPQATYSITLRHGAYVCDACDPPFSVMADGAYHKVTGSPYVDEISVTILCATSVIETYKSAGRLVASFARRVSDDGTSLTVSVMNAMNSRGVPVLATETDARAAPPPPGTAGISGAWRPARIGKMSANGRSILFASEGDLLTLRTPLGAFYTAPVGGAQVSYLGDPGVDAVAVKKLDDHSFEERCFLHGKAVRVVRYAVAGDALSMEITRTDLGSGRVTSMKAYRQ